MEILRNFFDKVKQEFSVLKEKIEFSQDLNKILAQFPDSNILDNYYYDIIKNQFVPKANIGINDLSQTNQYLDVINSSLNQMTKGITSNITIKANDFETIPFESTYFVNSIRIRCTTKNAGYNAIQLNVYLWQETDVYSQYIEILNDYVFRTVDSHEVILYFKPTKKFFIGFTNLHSSYDLNIQYICSFLPYNPPEVYTYEFTLNNTYRYLWITRHDRLFNRCAIMLYDGTNINADIDIETLVSQAQGIEIVNETENSASTEYYEIFELPTNYDFGITLKNNKSSTLTCRVVLFFSNSEQPELILNDLLDVVISAPADNELLAYDSASGNFINQTYSEANLSPLVHTHPIYELADAQIPKIETGAYTGDGSTSKIVYLSSISEQVRVVFIWQYWSADNDDAILHMKSYSDGNFANLVTDGGNDWWRDNRINQMSLGYFYVDDDGGDYHPNKNGRYYRYMAICW